MNSIASDATDVRALYIDLLKQNLTGTRDNEIYRLVEPLGWRGLVFAPARKALNLASCALVRRSSMQARNEGRDWPLGAETMVGARRLENLEMCITAVLMDGVPGDLLEAGVWRGGASIFMRGVLAAYGAQNRTVWVADSFLGLPKPDPAKYPLDRGDEHHTIATLSVALEAVKANFARYGLLDEHVRFLVGWFADSLPAAPVDKLAVLRVDADMYGSTMDVLVNLYRKLSVGGYIIIDDYGNEHLPCKAAVDDFRRQNGITEPIEVVDWTGVYWRRRR